MSSDPDDDHTGYGKPPKHTQWKEGQSGNPKRRYPKRAESTVNLIDKLLLKLVEITVGEKTYKVTTLEAILRRLWLKEFAGDTRALKIWLKFQELARQFSRPRVEIVFVDNDYTTAFAAIPLDKDEDDE
jgi:Family of unknown function (DUF5681)